MQGQLQNIDT